MIASNPKGHSRMILDAAWAPSMDRVFATAGRDKQVKIWSQVEGNTISFGSKVTISEEYPVTAIDFLDQVLGNGQIYLAVGTEFGMVILYYLDVKAFSIAKLKLDYPL